MVLTHTLTVLVESTGVGYRSEAILLLTVTGFTKVCNE